MNISMHVSVNETKHHNRLRCVINTLQGRGLVVCWSLPIPAHESQLINIQEFCELLDITLVPGNWPC